MAAMRLLRWHAVPLLLVASCSPSEGVVSTGQTEPPASAGASSAGASGVAGSPGGTGGTQAPGGTSAGTVAAGTGGLAGGGGVTGVGGAGGGGGVAGVAGISGSAGFPGAGAGGTKPLTWQDCTLPGTCEKRSPSCCTGCDTDIDYAVYAGLADQFDKEICPILPEPCENPCHPDSLYTGQNLQARCEEAKCELVDVRTDAMSACQSDADCVLHHEGCCPLCAGDLAHTIALSLAGVATYEAQACNPEAPVACPSCAPAYPDGAKAVCNAKHHCEMQRPASLCPVAAPVEGSACVVPTVQFCDYGEGVPVVCRDRYWCESGAWVKKVDPACVGLTPPLPCPPGVASGQACASDAATCLTTHDQPCTCLDGAWACVEPPPQSACPLSVPHNGQSCADVGGFVMCLYGGCGQVTDARRDCDSGVWVDRWSYCLP